MIAAHPSTGHKMTTGWPLEAARLLGAECARHHMMATGGSTFAHPPAHTYFRAHARGSGFCCSVTRPVPEIGNYRQLSAGD